MKKIISILLVLMMLFSITAFAENGPGGTPPGDPPGGGMGMPPGGAPGSGGFGGGTPPGGGTSSFEYTAANEITEVVDRIENEIMQRDSREIPSTEVGELVMKHLRQLDDVAYVRFASVYREFKDVDTFLEEILKIAKKS